MARKQLVVRIGRDGAVEAETVGMVGEECLDYFAVLEDLLDAEVVDSTYTEDYAAARSTEEVDAAARRRAVAETGADQATEQTIGDGA